jgi:ligand-binding sensor domain-containing protein
MPNFVSRSFVRLLCVGCWLLTSWVASAQRPLFRPHTAPELGDRWRTQVMLQDHTGRLWLGGKRGLVVYDGHEFMRICGPDSTRKFDVRALVEFEAFLWVGMADGSICRLPTVGNEQILDRWQPEEGTPSQPITSMVADTRGGLWIGTYGEGLYCLKTNRLYQFNVADDGLAGDEINALAADANGQVWAATDGGLSRCALSDERVKSAQNFTTAEGLPDDLTTSLHCTPNQKLWVGTHDHGLVRLDVATQQIEAVSPVGSWPHGPVTDLEVYGDGTVWVATETAGLLRGAEKTLRFEPQSPVTAPGRGTLLCDREGLLWAAFEQAGLWSTNARYGLLAGPYANVQAVLSDSEGQRWVGTSKGLFFEKNGTPTRILSPQENVLALWQAPDGRVWVGTFGNGVYVLDGTTGRIRAHLTERDGLANGSVLSVGGDGRYVWLATLGGVIEIDTKATPLRGTSLPIGSNYVYKVLADRQGRVWFGTDGKGLVVREQGTYRNIVEDKGVPLKTVLSLTEDAAGQVWFGTDDNRVFCYGTDGQLRQWKTHKPLVSLQAMPHRSEIYIVYEHGLDILTPSTGHLAWINPRMGIPTVQANLNAACTDADGHILLGTREGVLQISATQTAFSHDPLTRISQVSVFLQNIDFQQKKQFAHNENYFVFEFQGIWMTAPDWVRYRYRLDGFDRDWNNTRDHLASYPNLPPGSYVFRVQATEHLDFEGVPEVTYTFVIHPPFWLTWWFGCVCLLLLGGLMYGYIRLRERRLQREAVLRRERVEAQFEVLKSQINPHFLFNTFNTLTAVIEENPRAAVEYVEQLADFYRSVMQYRERDLIPIGEEIEVVKSFDFLIQKRYESGFQTHIELDGVTGMVIPFALQMLVENAVKHNVITQTRPLVVDIFFEKNTDYLVVRNNLQPKIKPEASTHFGLESLVRRYELLGGAPVLVEQSATHFTVRIPMIKN